MQLNDQHVFITGGGSGIGLALAREFLARGNRVTICGRSAAKLQQAAVENPGLDFIVADISGEGGLRLIAEELSGRLGSVSILVNNAASGDAYCLRRDPEAFLRMEQELATDLLAPMRLTRLFLPQLKGRKNPAVVNITSGYALWPCPVLPGYSVSKAGLRAFTRILRAQLRGTGIRVFEVLPPLVDTSLVSRVMQRKLTPAKVAAATLAGMAHDCAEICIGEVRLLRLGNRFWPWLTDRIMMRYPIPVSDLEQLYPPGDDHR